VREKYQLSHKNDAAVCLRKCPIIFIHTCCNTGEHFSTYPLCIDSQNLHNASALSLQ